MARARSVRGAFRDRLRARIVLAAAAGMANTAIARELGVCADTVRKWRRRFAASRLAGLKDSPRSG
ncbi:MAG: helix-turn-helix domain-containing protein, partial [Streptosporangiaceae bacterium]